MRKHSSYQIIQHDQERILPGHYNEHRRKLQRYTLQDIPETKDDVRGEDRRKRGIVADFVGSIVENKIRLSENRSVDKISWLEYEKSKYSWEKNEFDNLVLEELKKQRSVYAKNTQKSQEDNIRLSTLESLIDLYKTFAESI